MTPPTSGRYPVLPMDLADAAGSLGLVAGVLSGPAPYFLGLTIALSLLLLATAIGRWQDTQRRRAGNGPARRWLGISVAASVAGWGFLLFHPAPLGSIAGPMLGASGVPLWSMTRRPMPYGGR